LDCAEYDFYTKVFNSPLSRTNDRLYSEYRSAVVNNPTWLAAELKRTATCGNSTVVGSRLSFVPKTREISRSICTEPTLNMLFQKGLGSFLESELRRKTRIDLSRQPVLNRKMAQMGSEFGIFGTIDLSSASDSISTGLVKFLLPAYAYRWFELARSPHTIFPDGSVVKLEMISSMGNGFTFPLQTMIFASLVMSCYRVLGIKPGLGRDGPQNFGVFGDDIIVRKEAYGFVVGCLEMCGFTVNDSKSFNTGHFRESCGGDYWKGHDVRGIYIKELTNVSHVYSAVNRIIRWSSRTGILLPKVVTQLYSSIPRNRRWFIPYSDGDAEGIKVPLELFLDTRSAFEENLLSRGDTPTKVRSTLLKERASRPNRRRGVGKPLESPGPYNSAPPIRYFASVAVTKSVVVPPDDKQACKLSGFQYNGDGLLLALLGGFIRDGRVALRESEGNRAKVRRRYSSSWNWTPTAGLYGRDFNWEYTAEYYLREPCN